METAGRNGNILFPRANFDVVVIAASLGGIPILQRALGGIHSDFPAPILVVQHTAPGRSALLAKTIGFKTHVETRHPLDQERLRAGTIYMAPPGRHMILGSNGECILSDEPRHQSHRPSADLLFLSAAQRYGHRALAVVLTGLLRDGADGSVAVRAANGLVIVQDPSTCEASSMPRAVIERGVVDFVLPPRTIGDALVSLVSVAGVTAMFGVERTAA